MNWHIVRHPETEGVGVVPDTSLEHHKALGWLRVGSTTDMDKDHVDLSAYADAPDLDAPAKPAAKTSKEN